VWHTCTGLISKLKSYGILWTFILWIKYYLSRRNPKRFYWGIVFICRCIRSWGTSRVSFETIFISPEPISPASVRPSVCPSLNDFFSRTTWPITTKLGGTHAWGMGIQLCSNKMTGPFWCPIKGKIRKILINIKKSSSREPQARMH